MIDRPKDDADDNGGYRLSQGVRFTGLHNVVPPIVCLCGNARYRQQFARAHIDETLKGHVVLSANEYLHRNGEAFGTYSEQAKEKVQAQLDELHLRKIDLADQVLVLNVGGYIGEDTRREIHYAIARGKLVRFLEDPVRCIICDGGPLSPKNQYPGAGMCDACHKNIKGIPRDALVKVFASSYRKEQQKLKQ